MKTLVDPQPKLKPLLDVAPNHRVSVRKKSSLTATNILISTLQGNTKDGTLSCQKEKRL